MAGLLALAILFLLGASNDTISDPSLEALRTILAILLILANVVFLTSALAAQRRYASERRAWEAQKLRWRAERERLEKRLEEAADRVQRSNAEMERFAYVAAHDLQEPLRQVASFNDLLRIRYAGQLDDTGKHYLSSSIAGAKHLSQMLRGLAEYTIASSSPLQMTEFPIRPMVELVVEELRKEGAAQGATLDLDGVPRNLLLWADQRRVRLVLKSLLSNALRFRRPEGEVCVQINIHKDNDAWTLAVADNGIGVDPHFGSRVFEMFSRYHAVGQYEGVGAGLAIAQKAVESHGGILTFEPSASNGSTFRVRIPLLLGGEAL